MTLQTPAGPSTSKVLPVDRTPPKPILTLEDIGLVETYPSRQYLYRRWGKEFGAWTNDGFGWFEWVPRWELIAPDGQAVAVNEVPIEDVVVPETDEPTFVWMSWIDGVVGDPAVALFERHWSRLRESHRTHDAIAAYVEEIPFDLRQAVSGLGVWQWVALEGATNEPAFAEYLTETVSRFGSMSLWLCWSLTQPHHQPKSWRLHFCRQLADRGTREVLAWLLGQPLAPGALKVVQKIDRIPIERGALRALCRVLVTPWKVSQLKAVARVRGTAATNLDVLPRWMWRHSIIKHINSPDFDLTQLGDTLTEAAERVTRPQHQKALADYLADSRTARVFVRRLVDEVDDFRWAADVAYLTPKERHTRAFAKPPTPGTNVLVPVTTPKDLRKYARMFQNCLSRYVVDVHGGNSYVYVWLGEERAAILLERMTADSPWFMCQIAGVRNAEVSVALNKQLTELFANLMGDKFDRLSGD
jgi:hypothetical protein